MQPFLSELTPQERNRLYRMLTVASGQYDRVAGFLIDSVRSWETTQGTAAFRSIMDAWQELGELRDHLNTLPVA